MDLDEPELERAADNIREQGRRALALPADTHKQTDVDAFTAAAVEAFGTIDILVNNVGGTLKRRLSRESIYLSRLVCGQRHGGQ